MEVNSRKAVTSGVVAAVSGLPSGGVSALPVCRYSPGTACRPPRVEDRSRPCSGIELNNGSTVSRP